VNIVRVIISIVRDKEAMAAIQTFKTSKISRIKRLVESVGMKIKAEAKRNVAVNTGLTQDKIEYHLIDNRMGVEVGVFGERALVAEWIEFGTAPHIIYPSSRQALYWPGASHPVDHVHHPGTKPRPFLFPSYLKWVSWFASEITNIIRSVK